MTLLSTSRRLLVALSLVALAACDVPAPDSTRATDPTEPVQVALLVPMDSPDAERRAIAQSLMNAAVMAQRDLQGVTLEITPYGTGADVADPSLIAQEAIDAGADVILGPLYSTTTAGVGPTAARANRLVLSLSNNPQVAGDNVFILGNTFSNTASRVLEYVRSQGLTQIAVVHPQGLEGQTAAQAVRDAAQQVGADIAFTGSYPLSVQGITDAVPPMARAIRAAGAEVVVLTDGPTGGLTFVAETLRGLGVRAEAVRFAGLQRWDASAQAMAQPGLDGGWFAGPDPFLASQFTARYQSLHGQAPHPLAGIAYDGIAAIGALVAEAAADGRNDAFDRARVTQPSGFAGVMGILRLRPDGLNDRGLAIFEVQDGVAVQVAPAPRSFAAGGA